MMPALLDILQQEHADMRRLPDLIIKQADTDQPPNFELLLETVRYCLTYPDQHHHPKEDLIYRTLRGHDPEEAAALDDIEAEHGKLTIASVELATAIKAAQPGRTRDVRDLRVMLRSFVRKYRNHMRKEDQEFLPYALIVIEPEEWSELEARITDPTDLIAQAKACDRMNDLLARDKFR